MSKSFNRQQAKFWAEEGRRKQREAEHRQNVRADMEVLDRFRYYVLRRAKVYINNQALIAAIDDYAEKLTGDRTALHSKNAGYPQQWWELP